MTIEELENRVLLAVDVPLISEFMASNESTLSDGDGNYPDWIEVHNPTDSAIDLAGWYLTDDPSDLSKWSFPDLPQSVLSPGEYLVVFASGQEVEDFVDSGDNLHTNFKLSSDGEYLALVLDDPVEGLVPAHMYDPEFPKQLEDSSYGLVQDSTTLVSESAPATVLIPEDGSLGLGWTSPAFDDSSWTVGTTGIGFERGVGQGQSIAYGTFAGAVGSQEYGGSLGMDFEVNTEITLTQLGVFDSGSDGLSRTITSQIWSRSGNSGALLTEITFTPSDSGILINGDRFKPLSTPLVLPPGSYTTVAYGYGVGEPNGNAGASGPTDEQKILDDGGGVISFVGDGRFGSAGAFPNSPDGGPAHRYSASTFQYQSKAYTEQIETDVESAMWDINSSSYIRLEFPVTDPLAFASLHLSMQYNDGFVAYLNGTEVASRNAPGSLDWSSDATAERTALESTTTEDINITSSLSALQAGTNVLAIHGLNFEADNDDFLIYPQLIASDNPETSEAVYFSVPTPGAPNDSTSSFNGFVADVTSDVEHGFYDAPFDVTLSTATPGATIRYTTTGVPPTATTGAVYAGPIHVESTTTLSFAAFAEDLLPTDVVTSTYLFLDDVVAQSGTPTGYPANWNSYVADYDISQNTTDLPLIAGDPGLSVAESQQVIKDSLLSLPTLSIVLPQEDLFDSANGIYANPAARGDAWERAASVEYLLPDGSPGFQINAGLQIMGFTSRNLSFNPKLSMRILFKKDYGPGRLNYPFFENSSIDSYNTIALRANARDSWSYSGTQVGATYLKDEFAKLTQADMGALAASGDFVHLYLNGLYWGIYNPTERPDGAFASEHISGEPEDYDVVKFCCPDRAIEGDTLKWDELRTLAAAGLASDADYQFIQGNNPDGTRNPAYEVLIDIDNFIDYVINGQYVGSLDWPGNYYVVRDRGADSEGFQYFTWDNDLAFSSNKVQTDPGHNWWTESPGEMDIALRANAEYRLRFADRVFEHYFHDGVLTPEVSLERWNGLADGIREALIAESARWGDNYGQLYTPSDQWENAIASVSSFLSNRSDEVLAQLRAHDLYPSVDAPSYNQQGGHVESGFPVTLSSSLGLIYYMLNGEDPRLPGGGIHPEAVLFDDGNGTNTVLIHEGAEWRFLDDGSNQGSAWKEPAFDDGLWQSGDAELGYGEGDEATVVGYVDTDPVTSGVQKNITTYFRKTFSVAGVGSLSDLSLRIKRDDGAVVYINGVEVARPNMPGVPGDPVDNTTTAFAAADDGELFDTFTVDPSVLVEGQNVIAVEIHQTASSSSDISFDLELVGVEFDPNGSPPIEINADTTISSRVLNGSEWSALNEARFTTNSPADATTLRITEINYNPYDALPQYGDLDVDNDDFEFIELTNIGAETIDLAGVELARVTIESELEGVDFAFPEISLPAGSSVLVVEDQAAFESRYGTGLNVVGQWSGGLGNGGETLTLFAADSSLIQQFRYDDSGDWPGRADGKGATLEVLNPLGNYDSGDNWRSSNEFGGSPGAEGTGPVFDVIVNEVLSHSDGATLDQIELYNRTTESVEVSKWYLSDSGSNLFKYQIANGTHLGADQYLVLNELQFGFGLDGQFGEDVWLIEADPQDGKPLRFADHLEFDATDTDVSLGRWSNGDPSGYLFPMTSQTFGSANSGPVFGDLLISEIHYNPASVPPAESGNIGQSELEFVELLNTSGSPLLVENWKVEGINYTFSLGTTVAVDEAIVVVTFDPVLEPTKAVAFRNVHGIGGGPRLFGPASGQLNNAGENVKVLKPEDPLTFLTGDILVDAVRYDELPPWPAAADGAGKSLTRTALTDFAPFDTSWIAEDPTPGAYLAIPILGDMNGDGALSDADVNPFVLALTKRSAYDLAYPEVDADIIGDVNQSGAFNFGDVKEFRALINAASSSQTLAFSSGDPGYAYASVSPSARDKQQGEVSVSSPGWPAFTQSPTSAIPSDFHFSIRESVPSLFSQPIRVSIETPSWERRSESTFPEVRQGVSHSSVPRRDAFGSAPEKGLVWDTSLVEILDEMRGASLLSQDVLEEDDAFSKDFDWLR